MDYALNTTPRPPAGFVLWLTGLPASGKTTLGEGLQAALSGRGYPVELLDGDQIRAGLSNDLGFSPADRRRQGQRVAFVAKLLARNGVAVIVPLISPYRDVREAARAQIERFVEVWVRCPIEECIRRDPKGMYAKALRGDLPDFTGVSAPYEEPDHAEVVVDTAERPWSDCVEEILRAVGQAGYLVSERD